MIEMQKPERMAKLPHYKGLPVPALTLIDDKGIPQFKVIDNDKVWELKRDKKCGICGESLDYWIAFMVTEEEVNSRHIFESPNHIDCLKYAFEICPWLYYSKATYSHLDKVNMEGIEIVSAHPDREITNERPSKLGIYICRSYENVIYKGYRVCKVPQAKNIEWIEGKEK